MRAVAAADLVVARLRAWPAAVYTGCAYWIVRITFAGSIASVRLSVTQYSGSARSDCRRFMW